MLDDRRRLQVDALAVEQNRHLPPTRKRQEFRCPVHTLLETHIAKREWFTRKAQHQRHLVGRKRMRAAVKHEARHRWASHSLWLRRRTGRRRRREGLFRRHLLLG